MTPDEEAEARWDSAGDDGEDAVMERQAIESAGPSLPPEAGRPDEAAEVRVRIAAQQLREMAKHHQAEGRLLWWECADLVADLLDGHPPSAAPVVGEADGRRLAENAARVQKLVTSRLPLERPDLNVLADPYAGPTAHGIAFRAAVRWIVALESAAAAAPSAPTPTGPGVLVAPGIANLAQATILLHGLLAGTADRARCAEFLLASGFGTDEVRAGLRTMADEHGYVCDQAVLDVINLYGDETLHSALDAIGFLPRAAAPASPTDGEPGE